MPGARPTPPSADSIEMGRSFDTIWMPGGGNLVMDDGNIVRFFAIKNGLVQSWSVGHAPHAGGSYPTVSPGSRASSGVRQAGIAADKSLVQ